jgi:DNA uptake protein ComE-like DNA-binding protein
MLGFSLGAAVYGQQELQSFQGARMVPAEWADGDSFLVSIVRPGKSEPETLVVRLYAVDCVETTLSRESDQRRVREQARHFGVADAKLILPYGLAAKRFTERELAEPFTLHTAYAQAEGRSGNPRIYAYVTTSEGRDLAGRLIEEGLARNKGIARRTPAGTSAEDYKEALGDLELRAAMKRTGAWSESDPERIVALREEERREKQDLAALSPESGLPTSPIDLNRATFNELTQLPGIGEVIADRILDAREVKLFQSIDDLRNRVKGIGEKTLEEIRPFLSVGNGEAGGNPVGSP